MGPFRRFRAAAVSAGVLLTAAWTLSITLAVSWIARRLPRRRFPSVRRVALVGTFYNAKWFVSHVTPLARSGVDEVIVVTDEAPALVPRVRFRCPPRWLQRTLGRPLAKLLWTIGVALSESPDVYMGYHIIPNSAIALLVARLFGRPACYQMTGGPIEVLGGGIGSENSWLTRLQKPSASLERLALSVVGEFDLVVVRGTTARRFLAGCGVGTAVAIVPGSVDRTRFRPAARRAYDLLFLGRLAEIKQPVEFVEIAAALLPSFPRLRGVMVGDGPLADEVRKRVEGLGLADRLELVGQRADVDHYLENARVLVLTSRSEGLSIALGEGMAAGAVPVVARVGDLADLVRHGENGYLVEPRDREAFVLHIGRLLKDDALWARLSSAAAGSVDSHMGLQHVTALWAGHLESLAGRTPG